MDLQDYLEMFKDMRDEAAYYQKTGRKENAGNMIEASARAIKWCDEAILAKNLQDAEMYYNEIRSELFECEEILEELGFGRRSIILN